MPGRFDVAQPGRFRTSSGDTTIRTSQGLEISSKHRFHLHVHDPGVTFDGRERHLVNDDRETTEKFDWSDSHISFVRAHQEGF